MDQHTERGPAGRVQVIRPAERSAATTQTTGMRREAAIAPEMTGTTRLWMGLATTPPGSVSAWHHHGDCETGIYILQGRGRFSWGPQGRESAEVSPGDFVCVPPYAVHREEALDAEDFILVLARGCSSVLSVEVPGPTSTGLAHER